MKKEFKCDSCGNNIKKNMPELKEIIDAKISYFKGKKKDKANGVKELEVLWAQLQESAAKPRNLKSLEPYLKNIIK